MRRAFKRSYYRYSHTSWDARIYHAVSLNALTDYFLRWSLFYSRNRETAFRLYAFSDGSPSKRDSEILFDICCTTSGDCVLSLVLEVPNCSSRPAVPPCVPSVYDAPTPVAWSTCCRIGHTSEAGTPCCRHSCHPENVAFSCFTNLWFFGVHILKGSAV